MSRGLDYHIDQFSLRTIQQCITESMSIYWIKRAQVLEDARHREGDFVGQATAEELKARDDVLTMAATNCRRHAKFLKDGVIDPWTTPSEIDFG